MTIGTTMKALAEDINRSSEERGIELAELSAETRLLRRRAARLVKESAEARRQSGQRLMKELAQSNSDRKKDVMERRTAAQDLVSGLRTSRKINGDHLRSELARSTKQLARDEKDRKDGVAGFLSGLHTSRKDGAAQLRSDLSEAAVNLRTEVERDLAAAHGSIVSYRSSRHAMQERLAKDLTGDRHTRKAQVEQMRSGFRETQSETRMDLKEASDAWKTVGHVVRATRAATGATPGTTLGTPARNTTDLKEKLLSTVDQHVAGISLSEVAETLGMATIALAKAASELTKHGKLRKEGRLYFSGAK